MTNDINVFLINMPPGINETVTENEDGSYTIFINDSLSPAGRLASYNHALQHIKRNDFDGENVQEIEALSHQAESRQSDPLFGTVPDSPKRSRRKRRQRATAKEWEDVNRRIAFMSQLNPNYAMREGEFNKLYRDL